MSLKCSQRPVPPRGKRGWAHSLVTFVLSVLPLLLASNAYSPAILTQNIKITSKQSIHIGEEKGNRKWNGVEITIAKITCKSFSLGNCIFYHIIILFLLTSFLDFDLVLQGFSIRKKLYSPNSYSGIVQNHLWEQLLDQKICPY